MGLVNIIGNDDIRFYDYCLSYSGLILFLIFQNPYIHLMYTENGFERLVV
jgi:hypothetical protein